MVFEQLGATLHIVSPVYSIQIMNVYDCNQQGEYLFFMTLPFCFVSLLNKILLLTLWCHVDLPLNECRMHATITV